MHNRLCAQSSGLPRCSVADLKSGVDLLDSKSTMSEMEDDNSI